MLQMLNDVEYHVESRGEYAMLVDRWALRGLSPKVSVDMRWLQIFVSFWDCHHHGSPCGTLAIGDFLRGRPKTFNQEIPEAQAAWEMLHYELRVACDGIIADYRMRVFSLMLLLEQMDAVWRFPTHRTTGGESLVDLLLLVFLMVHKQRTSFFWPNLCSNSRGSSWSWEQTWANNNSYCNL